MNQDSRAALQDCLNRLNSYATCFYPMIQKGTPFKVKWTDGTRDVDRTYFLGYPGVSAQYPIGGDTQDCGVGLNTPFGRAVQGLCAGNKFSFDYKSRSGTIVWVGQSRATKKKRKHRHESEELLWMNLRRLSPEEHRQFVNFIKKFPHLRQAITGLASRVAGNMQIDGRLYTAMIGTRSFADVWDLKTDRMLSSALPLPMDCPRVLLVGAFGSGKSSLVRQLIGTVGEHPGFPAVSAARTTIALTELVCWPDPEYRAVAVFTSSAEIERHVEDNAVAACHEARRGFPDTEIVDALLTHRDNRIRFELLQRYYGSGGISRESDQDSDLGFGDSELDAIVRKCRHAAPSLDEFQTHPQMGKQYGATGRSVEADFRSVKAVSKALMSLIQRSKDSAVSTTPGEFTFDGDGWPLTWSFTTRDRREFLTGLESVAGNGDARFSRDSQTSARRLLSPLVRRLRVAGPFKPSWCEDVVPMVLIDTEGYGHVEDWLENDKAASRKTGYHLPHRIVKVATQMMLADEILIVENAHQPLNPLGQELLQAAALDGSQRRLKYIFTRLDQIIEDGGGRVHDEDSAISHVRSTLALGLRSVQTQLGEGPVSHVSIKVRDGTLYLAHVNGKLEQHRSGHVRTLSQLQALVDEISSLPSTRMNRRDLIELMWWGTALARHASR